MTDEKETKREWLARKWDRLLAHVAYYLITFGARVHPPMFEVFAVNFVARRAQEQGGTITLECPCPECTAEREANEPKVTYH